MMTDDTPTENLTTTSHPVTVKLKPKKLPAECKICGAAALYSYFGVVVCSSCKMFFKRNAEKKQFTCVYNGHCDININNRHICTACRLAKCFATGMQVGMIRAARTAKTNRSEKTKVTRISTVSATQKQKHQPEQLPTLNLLERDTSTLTINEWNLLSNITHCYDENSGHSLAKRFSQKQNELPVKMRFKTASVVEFFTSIISNGQHLYERNADFISLCPHDRSILLNNTVKYVTAIGSCMIARSTHMLDNPAFYKSAENIYGPSTLATTCRSLSLMDADGAFIQLVLALLTFSTFDQTSYTMNAADNFNNVEAIFRIQDIYTGLAWRYVLYKCGHERALVSFSNMIRCQFSLKNTLVEAVEHKQYTDMISSLIKQTEERFTITE